MAQVFQPPFWVPRPADNYGEWQGNPLHSGIIIALTKQKIFGAGGQVPTKEWSRDYGRYNDPPETYIWSKVLNSGPIQLTLTQVQIFGQHGQGPTKNWSSYFGTYNDPPETYLWSKVLNSGPIQLTLTQVQIFGQHGQAPPSRWKFYIYDDPPTWWPASETQDAEAVHLVPALMQIPRAKVWQVFYGDDSPVWYPSIESLDSEVMLHTVAPFVFEQQWPYRHDESPMWQGAPIESNINFLPSGHNPFVNLYWPYSFDETSTVWQADVNPRNSAPIQILTVQQIFGQGGQVPPFRWNYTLDDPSVWQWPSGVRNRNALSVKPFSFNPNYPLTYDDTPSWQWIYWRNFDTLSPVVNPFVNTHWSTYDEASTVWLARQLDSYAITLTTTQTAVFGQHGQVPPFRWNATLDDPPSWPAASVASNLNFIPVAKFYGQVGQVVPFRWNATYDDASLWQSGSDSSAIIQILTSQKVFSQGGQVPPFRWNWTNDETASWQWTGERSFNVLQPTVIPFVNVHWPYTYDESSTVWAAKSFSSYAITLTTTQKVFFGQPGQVLPFRWNATLDDHSSWQWPLAERNRNVLQPSGEPFSNRPTYWYSEDAFWQGAPIISNVHFLPPLKTPVFQPPMWVPRPVDETFWAMPSATKNPNLIPITTFYGQAGQVLPFRWNATYDDSSLWQSWSDPSAILQILTKQQIFGQGGQVPPFRWNYTLNDPPTWPAAPIASNINFIPVVSMYGQAGQAPPFRWNATYDDSSFWQNYSDPSAIIQISISQTIYGVGGQVPPFRWNFTFDDASLWQGVPIAVLPQYLIQHIVPRGALFVPRPPDEYPWPAWPFNERNINVLQPSGEPFSNYRIYFFSEDAVWQWPMSERNPNVLTPSSTMFNSYKVYWYSEDASWQGSATSSYIIPALTQGGQLKPSRWNHVLDEITTWQWPVTARNRNILFLNFPIVYPPATWYSEDAFWLGKPTSSQIIPALTQQKFFSQIGQGYPFRWNYTLDDASTWQWPMVERNRNIFAAFRVIMQPPIWYSEDAFWLGMPLSSQALFVSTGQTRFYGNGAVPFRWNYTLDDASTWQWPMVERNPNVLFSSPIAVTYPLTHWYSEDAFWLGKPTASAAVSLLTVGSFYGQGGQVIPFRWNYTLDDASVWQWRMAERNPNVLLPPQGTLTHPPISWYSEDAFWQGSPTRAEIISTLGVPKIFGQGGQAPPFRWNATLDDPPMWQGTPFPAVTALHGIIQRIYSAGGQVPPFRWNFTFNDPPMFQGAPDSSAVIQLLTAVNFYGLGGEVLPRWWRFNYDDHSAWWPTMEMNYSIYFPITTPPSGPPSEVNSARTIVGSYTSITNLGHDE